MHSAEQWSTAMETAAGLSSVMMPAGLEWHRYLPPSPDGRVRIDARSERTAHGSDGWPVRTPRAARRTGGPDALGVNAYFSDWSEASMRVGAARGVMTADPVLAHLVVHRRPGYPCLEPVSHVAGALATLPEMHAETGLRLLEPGESMAASLTLRVEDLAGRSPVR